MTADYSAPAIDSMYPFGKEALENLRLALVERGVVTLVVPGCESRSWNDPARILPPCLIIAPFHESNHKEKHHHCHLSLYNDLIPRRSVRFQVLGVRLHCRTAGLHLAGPWRVDLQPGYNCSCSSAIRRRHMDDPWSHGDRVFWGLPPAGLPAERKKRG